MELDGAGGAAACPQREKRRAIRSRRRGPVPAIWESQTRWAVVARVDATTTAPLGGRPIVACDIVVPAPRNASRERNAAGRGHLRRAVPARPAGRARGAGRTDSGTGGGAQRCERASEWGRRVPGGTGSPTSRRSVQLRGPAPAAARFTSCRCDIDGAVGEALVGASRLCGLDLRCQLWDARLGRRRPCRDLRVVSRAYVRVRRPVPRAAHTRQRPGHLRGFGRTRGVACQAA
jgi:hypothetical protein